MPELRIIVNGKPEPAGSKKAFAAKAGGEYTGRVIVADDNDKAKGWKQLVATAAREARGAAPPGMFIGPLECALWVTMTFYLARPKDHYGTGRFAGELKPSAPEFPLTRPDALKLARGTEDALTGVIWKDDAQVVNLVTKKYYADLDGIHHQPRPGALIWVRWELAR
jgi:Holliday junction resolvase RusA-like endonuclease